MEINIPTQNQILYKNIDVVGFYTYIFHSDGPAIETKVIVSKFLTFTEV